MYSYNSSHKIFVVLIVVAWAMYHFTAKSDDPLYYENGQVIRTGSQVNSLNEGMWIWYYSNGAVQIRGNYEEGKRIGLWEEFDSLGHLLTTSQYVDNHLNGYLTHYNIDGEVSEQFIYSDDVVIKKVELH